MAVKRIGGNPAVVRGFDTVRLWRLRTRTRGGNWNATHERFYLQYVAYLILQSGDGIGFGGWFEENSAELFNVDLPFRYYTLELWESDRAREAWYRPNIPKIGSPFPALIRGVK